MPHIVPQIHKLHQFTHTDIYSIALYLEWSNISVRPIRAVIISPSNREKDGYETFVESWYSKTVVSLVEQHILQPY
jgi:hypothetical protein